MGENLKESDLLKELVSRYENKIGNFDKIQDLFENCEEYNPWNTEKTSELSKEFFAALKNDDKEFSWLKIDNDLYEELKDKTKKAASIDYGIPSHVRGDIENGTLFLCLVNPNIEYKGSQKKGITSFYEEARKLDSDDQSLKVIDENGKISITDQKISNYIVNTDPESSILYNELDSLYDKIKKDKKTPKKYYGYYLSRYFPQIIISYMNKKEDIQPLMQKLKEDEWDKVKQMSTKIVDLEAFPFRSSKPHFAKKTTKDYKKRFANCLVKSTSNVSMLSARIIIWRIVKYLKDINEDINITRPKFVFRRFNTVWLPSLVNALYYDLGYTNNYLELIEELHEYFFLTIDKKSSNMMRGYIGKRLFKNNTMLSDDEFDEFVRETLK
ncbi:hypothetical protein [Finegoldia magna]|uniref:hypothetical protein n=1 Tax=Finegoldia magna TaxID=1260 RepID=UPI001CE16559|nr:hypothetical protein [Finegoldia magna]MCA5587381.1 hypothetical protein [Finegoldia magna]MDU2219322.1 hypothetical protein [Finegoldia magna]MDU5960389.1 hypothetical protein [Finegoldia magna]